MSDKYAGGVNTEEKIFSVLKDILVELKSIGKQLDGVKKELKHTNTYFAYINKKLERIK